MADDGQVSGSRRRVAPPFAGRASCALLLSGATTSARGKRCALAFVTTP